MRRSRVNQPAERKEPRHGLKDMFIDRPGGDAGKILSMVWGDSLAEFGEIVALEIEDQQQRQPGRFVNKIAPRVQRKGPTKPCQS